jgi:hypothetical protein
MPDIDSPHQSGPRVNTSANAKTAVTGTVVFCRFELIG